MNSAANLFFRASMSLLMLSFVVCVVAKLDASENQSINRVLNPKQDVPSTLGSILVRHISRPSDGYQTSTMHTVIRERMKKKRLRRNRKHKMNMRRRKMAVLAKSRKPMDKDEPSDSPRLPDKFEANQFTFTSPDSRGLTIQVKPFVRFQGTGRRRRRSAVSYKVYVLEGNNIRHYNVQFPPGGLRRATLNERQRVANCVRRRYLRRCIDLRLRKKGSCTTRIVEKCIPGFLVFEVASPATLGTRRSSPLPSFSPIPSPSPEPETQSMLDSADEDEDQHDSSKN